MALHRKKRVKKSFSLPPNSGRVPASLSVTVPITLSVTVSVKRSVAVSATVYPSVCHIVCYSRCHNVCHRVGEDAVRHRVGEDAVRHSARHCAGFRSLQTASNPSISHLVLGGQFLFLHVINGTTPCWQTLPQALSQHLSCEEQSASV